MSLFSNITTAVTDTLAKEAFNRVAGRIQAGTLTVETPDGKKRVIESGGAGPTAILQIKDNAFYKRMVLHGEIGFGEAYVDGLCDSPNIVPVLELAIVNRRKVDLNKGPLKLFSRRRNQQLHKQRANTLENSKHNIHAHYDIGNDFFKLWLDETMTYSSAVFEHPDQPLADAQRNKYRRMCEKAEIASSDHVLEIGSGWGGFAIYAAQNHGCSVTTVTISKEQHDLAVERIKEAGLSDKIEVRLQDYREIEGQFDKIISIEMFEAVGSEFFETFFMKCSDVLKPNGKLVMQVITVPDEAFEFQKTGANWIQKYIFPGGELPSVEEMERRNARTGLVLTGTDEIGLDYAVTLRLWRQRFWEQIDAVRAMGYDERFVRMWDYYLAACEAGFLTRLTGDVQVAFEKRLPAA
ncbi:MAG: cyclopropane-fatty-acyl-phospholipid synthase family protein [Dehalococcoidia bacterium]